MHAVPTAVPVPRPRPDLAAWLLGAARRWHAADDPATAVRAVLEDVAALLPAGASASLTLLGTGRRPLPPEGDAGSAAALDAVQIGSGQGPLLTALAGTAAGSGDLGRDLRWPALAAPAGAAGVRTATCLPLDTGTEVLGALSVYATGPVADRAVLVPVAGQAALALSAVRRTANLAVALESRDLIGQAKGVLMERHRITADIAFGILVRASRDTQRKVRDVAALVTETGETPPPAGDA
ncbi:ANTAR domain-containing protein [Geodermatophilus sp. SYSU D00710]